MIKKNIKIVYLIFIHFTKKGDDDEDKDDDEDEVDLTGRKILKGGDTKELAQRISEKCTEDFRQAMLNLRQNPDPNSQLQHAFQPSCSNVDNKGRRYLVYNDIGYITSTYRDNSYRIDIVFTNTRGLNKNDILTDNMFFTMAALSYEGAVFANDPRDDGSSIYYHAFRERQRHHHFGNEVICH